MWNKVATVAKHHKIEPADLVDFALSNEQKYCITMCCGDAEVSNFHVEKLLADYARFVSEFEALENLHCPVSMCEFD